LELQLPGYFQENQIANKIQITELVMEQQQQNLLVLFLLGFFLCLLIK